MAYSFVVLGASEFTSRCAIAAQGGGHKISAIISMAAHLRPNNAASLSETAKALGTDYFEFGDINSADAIEAIRHLNPDFILSGWPHKLGPDVLSSPRYFVIGTHPTYLPANRGRHPIHWAIVLGVKKMAVSFFRMTEQFDRGPVLHLQAFELSDTDTINSANEKMNEAAVAGLGNLLARLSVDPTLGDDKPTSTGGNSWRARSIHDVTIDPRLPANMIATLVRSFCPPYPGARLLVGKHQALTIESAETFDAVPTIEGQHGRQEYGRILQQGYRKVRMVCGDGRFVVLTTTTPITITLPSIVHPPSKYLASN